MSEPDWEQYPWATHFYPESDYWYSCYCKVENGLVLKIFWYGGWEEDCPENHPPIDKMIKRPNNEQENNMKDSCKKVTREQLISVLSSIDDVAQDFDSYECGLPLHKGSIADQLVEVLLQELDLELDEAPEISKIMKYTGCSREQAVELFNNWEK